MNVLCFSSFTFSYLDRARVLFHSLRAHHPDWELVALITDAAPPGLAFDADDEPFDRIVWGHEVGLPDYEAFLFQHDIVEMCTAVKGPFLDRACSDPAFAKGADAVIYMDPDTAVFAPLDPVIVQLEQFDIVLTPHLAGPEIEAAGIGDNELSALRTGVYNLGFVAIRTFGEGARFARWWSERLQWACYDDIPAGLFTDQRWCDQVPTLFDRVHILRDPGFNIASWNVGQRWVTIGHDGVIRANGATLRFWHFTKLGPVGDAMTRRHAKGNAQVYEIWNWYKRRIEDCAAEGLPQRWWAYGSYEDGAPIPKADRIAYRQDVDLRVRFTHPFASGEGSFQAYRQAVAQTDALG
jgi:hypothetical protein